MITAVRHNVGETIQANYAYTYDDGDNLVTKVEPWTEDYEDGSLSGLERVERHGLAGDVGRGAQRGGRIEPADVEDEHGREQ